MSRFNVHMPNDSENARYRRGMAFHEAGHAVVAWSLNLPVGEIYIRDIGAGNGGAQIGCADQLSLTDQLATLVAGAVAEHEFKSHLPEYAADDDRLRAINLVLKHHDGISPEEIEPHLAAGHARAHELLVEHRDKIIRLAGRLLKVRKVDAVEFKRLIET